jgi:hypothetical protein
VTSLRATFISRMQLEIMGVEALRTAQTINKTSTRYVRDPRGNPDNDFLRIISPDPDAAIEPPGYETGYVTGGEWRSS